MKVWLQGIAWKLAVTLGLIEPPRMQPIPIRSDEQRRLMEQRRRY
ncbi:MULTISPECIES: PA1414 family protein [unclassified Pseudomonas]|nr:MULTISPECIES: PA1414 family protein [unclassified Pseudomonas]